MKRKVIFLIGTLSGGGAERVVSNLTMNLEDTIDREIILFGDRAKIEYNYKGKITYLDKASLKNPIDKIVILFRRIKKIKKIKKDNPNTPFISLLEYPNLLNIISGNHKNSIVSVRNFMSTKHSKGLKAYFWNLTIKYLYKGAKKIIVVSEQMKNDLIINYHIPRDKIKVIYNSYPIKQITELAFEKLNNQEQIIFNNPTIITSGRLNYQKGQKHLINAFKIVKQTIPKARLVFLGEGSLEKSLKEQARKLGVGDSVHFLGFQNNPFKFIVRSKIFVMTSYFEGFPNALAEAMVCRVPVISTDCPSGPREILAPYEENKEINYNNNEKRYGHLVPMFNEHNKEVVEKQIADIIINLISNKEKNKYYADLAHNRIKDFDINRVINEWIKLFDE